MATTGTASLTCTRDQLITEVYKKIRVLAEGQTASATQISDVTLRLNMIIKNCMSNGLMLWTYQQIVVPNVAAQVAYTIGPVGADITTTRPLRISEYGNFIRQVQAGANLDTPVRVISRAEYLQFGNKTAPGVINTIYYDSQFNTATTPSPSTGYGTLYVYVAPADTSRTLYLNAQRQLYDMTTGTDEFDFPSEWYYYLLYALAADIADDNEVPEDRITRLERTRDKMLNDLADWSVETSSATFTADTHAYRASR
jgi:hypothetical protein